MVFDFGKNTKVWGFTEKGISGYYFILTFKVK